jgi:hypothetical protein
MRMATIRKKPIACWPETNTEGGIESTSQGDARKDDSGWWVAKQAWRRSAKALSLPKNLSPFFVSAAQVGGGVAFAASPCPQPFVLGNLLDVP